MATLSRTKIPMIAFAFPAKGRISLMRYDSYIFVSMVLNGKGMSIMIKKDSFVVTVRQYRKDKKDK